PSRVPAPQPGGGERVVGEQEVLDRVLLAAEAPCAMGCGQRVGPVLVRAAGRRGVLGRQRVRRGGEGREVHGASGSGWVDDRSILRAPHGSSPADPRPQRGDRHGLEASRIPTVVPIPRQGVAGEGASEMPGIDYDCAGCGHRHEGADGTVANPWPLIEFTRPEAYLRLSPREQLMRARSTDELCLIENGGSIDCYLTGYLSLPVRGEAAM